MSTYICIPLIICFLIGLIMGPVVIPVLKRAHASQTEREELKSHQKKTGTPTMGGFIFLIAIVATGVFTIPSHIINLPVLILMLGFGIIGFIDDYLKVVLKRSDGLKAKQKFALQFILTGIFLLYLGKFSGISLALKIPFLYGYEWDIGILIYPVLFFAILGTVNGVNFTDGLDGLATTVTIVVAVFFACAVCFINQELILMPVLVIGGLMAFLVYNVYPAKTFMGDTGSLALGGFVAGMACMTGLSIFIIIFGFIYLIEVLSVIIQVTYFRKTGGKRIFRMAPIHHHFELGGWSETKIVAIFSIVTAILSMIAMLGLVSPGV